MMGRDEDEEEDDEDVFAEALDLVVVVVGSEGEALGNLLRMEEGGGEGFEGELGLAVSV
jgi:hypothetical protein